MPALHQAALELPVNEISPPLIVGDSLYIVQVIEKAKPLPLSFEEARPYLKQRLSDEKHDQLLLQLQDRLAKQVNLVIYDRVLQAYADKFARATPVSSNQPFSPSSLDSPSAHR